MRALAQDVRYAFRLLVNDPGFTCVAVLALALGIGVNSAIFSVAHAVLLKPFAYEQPQRLLVMVWERNPAIQLGSGELRTSAANHVFADMAGFRDTSFSLAGQGDPERIAGASVSQNLFRILGVRPIMGRTFLPEEDRVGSKADVILIGHALWQRRFGGDPGIVGKSVRLNDEPHTVVGVMPPGFEFPKGAEMPVYFQIEPRTEIWRPLAFSEERAKNRGGHFLPVIARLKPGTTLAQARAEMAAIGQRLAQEYPNTNTGWRTDVVPFHEQVVGSVKPVLLVLFAAVGFVLLIACVNVANMFLARATGRQREIAIRVALGAGRGRIVRQLLVESVLLALAGGACGLLLALWGVPALVAISPSVVPRLSEVRVDAQALAWTVMIAMTTGILFGLLPALEASRPDLQGNLREGARGMAGSRRKTRMQGALIVSEVALAVVLLTGACLLLRSFVRLQQVDPGFRTENVVTMQIVLPRARYGQVQRSWTFYSQVLERVRALPGVLQASAVSEIPLSGRAEIDSFEAEGTPADPAKSMLANFHVVAGDYFPALAIPILQGRGVGAQESREGLRVAVISEASARELWPGRDAIGRRLRMGPRSPWLTVVGVAGDLRHTALSGRERPEVYIPYAQMDYTQDMNLVVRTAADPASLASAIRAQVWAVDRDQPVDHVRTMQQIVAESTSLRRFSTLLVTAFAGLAMVLAAIGIYGVISYSVTRRKHEFGVRLALGAGQRDVVRMVLRQGLGLVSIGVCVGIVSALALTRFLTGLLYGVAALDPLTYVAVPLILVAVAIAACVVPAVRAMEVNPVVALRCE